MIQSEEQLLARIVAACSDPAILLDIRENVIGILGQLGVPRPEASAWFDKWLMPHKPQSLYAFERMLHEDLKSNSDPAMAADAAEQLAFERCEDIFPHLLEPGTTMLDIGGGSGRMARRFSETGYPCHVADINEWAVVDIPFVYVDGWHVDAADKSYDQVLYYTTLHHAEKPERLLSEGFRIARRRVIIAETTPRGLRQFMGTCVLDWICNRITFHYTEQVHKKIPVPCNFRSAEEWETVVWKLCQRRPAFSAPIEHKQEFAPLPHHLLIYDL